MNKILIIGLLFLATASIPVYAQTETKTENTAASQHTKLVDLYYFWSRYCPHCIEAKPFIHKLSKTYPWLDVHSYDLINNKDNQQRYLRMASQLNQTANSIPGFIFCDQMMIGFDKAETTGLELENRLTDCHQQKEKQHLAEAKVEYFNIPGLGNMHYQTFSLPVFTLIIATLDAFNPCAFFILFFLLSLMVHHRSCMKMLIIGCTFVLCSGLMYFLFMSAWLNLFLITEQLIIITTLAGVIAVCFGLINIKDYFFFKQGISLSLSDSAKSRLYTRIRSLTRSESWPTMLFATFILAIAANSYELLCTAGLPMVYTRVLTLNELSNAQYYLYLALYNFVYIIPLLIIVIMFSFTLGNKKLSEHEGRLLKLLSGSMMLGLGMILLLNPLWRNMLISVGVISGAMILTAIAALLQKLKV